MNGGVPVTLQSTAPCRDRQIEEKREAARRAAEENRAADASMEAERLRALQALQVSGLRRLWSCRT
jgi:hypothetical protein